MAKSNKSNKSDRLIKWRPVVNSKARKVALSLGSLLGLVGILSLTFLYSNCSEMKSLKHSAIDLSSDEGTGLFGSFDANTDDPEGHLTGHIGFNKASITEGDTVNFDWVFNWGVSGNEGHYFDSFSCTPGLLGGSVSGDGSSFLGVTHTCRPAEFNNGKSCAGHANGQVTLTPSASQSPYSCKISFKNIVSNKYVTLSVNLKVNAPANKICEGDELWQGVFDGCDSSACKGWAFNYGQISLPITLKITQSGAKNRVAIINTATLSKRPDVDKYLAAQGCLNTGDLLAGFSVSTGEIDNALKNAKASAGSGSASSSHVVRCRL